MKIHNIMEEEVEKRVNSLYEQVKESGNVWFSCDCKQCRLDTTCYVLNRIPSKYVVSGRGMNHYVSSNNTQTNIDIDALIVEAMKTVSALSRPYHTDSSNVQKNIAGPYYNFPTFFGNIYDGNSFEPLINAKVTLTENGKESEMLDNSWQNPCFTQKNTNGTYSFLVKPMEAKEQTKVFSFKITVSHEGYEDFSYNFELPILKDEKANLCPNSTYSVKMKDIILFPKED